MLPYQQHVHQPPKRVAPSVTATCLEICLKASDRSGTTKQFNVAASHATEAQGTWPLLHRRGHHSWSLQRFPRKRKCHRNVWVECWYWTKGTTKWKKPMPTMETTMSGMRALRKMMANWRNNVGLWKRHKRLPRQKWRTLRLRWRAQLGLSRTPRSWSLRWNQNEDSFQVHSTACNQCPLVRKPLAKERALLRQNLVVTGTTNDKLIPDDIHLQSLLAHGPRSPLQSGRRLICGVDRWSSSREMCPHRGSRDENPTESPSEHSAVMLVSYTIGRRHWSPKPGIPLYGGECGWWELIDLVVPALDGAFCLVTSPPRSASLLCRT